MRTRKPNPGGIGCARSGRSSSWSWSSPRSSSHRRRRPPTAGPRRTRSHALPRGRREAWRRPSCSCRVARRGIFERGPFHLFVAPGAPLREGRPIPAAAIRLGTFTVEPVEDGYVELRALPSSPDLSAGFHSVQLCNDPCTVAGFRDQLFGAISVVATARGGAPDPERSPPEPLLRDAPGSPDGGAPPRGGRGGPGDAAVLRRVGARSADVRDRAAPGAVSRDGGGPGDGRRAVRSDGRGAVVLLALVAAALAFRRRRVAHRLARRSRAGRWCRWSRRRCAGRGIIAGWRERAATAVGADRGAPSLRRSGLRRRG